MQWNKVFDEERRRTSFDLLDKNGTRYATVRMQCNRWIFTSMWLNGFSHSDNCPVIPIHKQDGESEAGVYTNIETAKKAAYMHVLQQLTIEKAAEMIYKSVTFNTPLTHLTLELYIQELKDA